MASKSSPISPDQETPETPNTGKRKAEIIALALAIIAAALLTASFILFQVSGLPASSIHGFGFAFSLSGSFAGYVGVAVLIGSLVSLSASICFCHKENK